MAIRHEEFSKRRQSSKARALAGRMSHHHLNVTKNANTKTSPRISSERKPWVFLKGGKPIWE
jgi:hypothetical protein